MEIGDKDPNNLEDPSSLRISSLEEEEEEEDDYEDDDDEEEEDEVSVALGVAGSSQFTIGEISCLWLLWRAFAVLASDQHEQWKRRPETQCRSVKVFRCQLPRSNPFYSSEPPRHDRTDKPSGDGAALCCWCGTWKGEKVCGSCKKARYCVEKHQVMHWCSAHKVECRRICATFQTSDSSKNQRTLPLMSLCQQNSMA